MVLLLPYCKQTMTAAVPLHSPYLALGVTAAVIVDVFYEVRTKYLNLATKQKLKRTDLTSRQRGRSTSTKPETVKKNIINERMGKIGRGSQMGA
jgi:hypothetical protein